MAYYSPGTDALARVIPSLSPMDPTPFHFKVKLASTQVDDLTDTVINVAGPFPTNTQISCSASWLLDSTDLDTAATPTLTLDLQVSAALAGTSPTVLISNSAVGQGAVGDLLDSVDATEGLDIGGKYLQIKIEDDVTTAAAGTITIKGYLMVGPVTNTQDLTGVSVTA
jgi:hypothetical protein